MVFLRKEKHPNATSLRKSYARVFREGKIKNMPNIATIGRVFSTLRNAGVLEEKKY
jgi:hypothetical protein